MKYLDYDKKAQVFNLRVVVLKFDFYDLRLELKSSAVESYLRLA